MRNVSANSAPITASVLRWALQDAGMSSDDIADNLELDPDIVEQWTTGDALPTKTQLRLVAKQLSRPESFFFLPKPPQRRLTTAAYRKHSSERTIGSPTAATYEGVQLAQRIQKVAAWTAERLDKEAVAIPAGSVETDPELMGKRLRQWLGWSVEAQITNESEAAVSQLLRQVVQEKGILALNLTLDEFVVRGFSLADSIAPLIAVNTRDTYPARIFSYVHEIAHLALDDASICLTRDDLGIEHWCNAVAACFLLPRSEFKPYVTKKFGTVSTTSEVSQLRRRYKVSLRAIAIRLVHLELAEKALYVRVDRDAEAKRRGGTYDPARVRTKPRVRLQSYGRKYAQHLVEAEEEGVLKTAQVLEFLQISSGELVELKEMLSLGLEG